MKTEFRSERWSRMWLAALLVGAAALRLVGVGNPILGHQSWRQADTAAIARNFVEEQFNILSPRIDWRGSTTGQVECEFPVYQFVLASLYRVFGIHESIGRLLSVFLSLLTMVGLYQLVRTVADERVALWAALFFAVLPLPTFFGRAVMPESLLLVGCVYGVYGFLLWGRNGSLPGLALSLAGMTIACLLKPPLLVLGLVFAYVAISAHGLRAARRVELWIYVLVLFGAIAAWFLHAHHLKQTTGLTFGIWDYGTDKWGNWALLQSWAFWKKIFLNRVPGTLLANFGLPLFVAGLVLKRRSSDERLFDLWLLGMFVLIVVVASGVYVHDYYLLPAVIPACYYLGKAVDGGLSVGRKGSTWVRVGTAFCVIGVIASSLMAYSGWLAKEDLETSAILHAGLAAQRVIPKASLIIAVDRDDPTLLYHTERKGWHAKPCKLRTRWLRARQRQGAAYVVGTHKEFIDNDCSYLLVRAMRHSTVIENNEDFFILKLKQ